MSLIPAKNPWQRRVVKVESDLTCVHCHYNLRGLPLSGQCPECAGSIWDSLLNSRYDAYRESMLRARRGSFALALWPALVIITLAAGQKSTSIEVVALLAGMLCASAMILGGPVWATMPLMQFQATDRREATILGSLLVGIPAISAGSALCGALAKHLGCNVTLVWDLIIVMAALQSVVLLHVPARMLLILGHEAHWRAIQTARVLCLALALGAVVSIFFQVAYPGLAFGEGLRWLAGLAALGLLILMSTSGIAFRSHIR